MPLDASDLDLIRRSETGVRGFLDLQDASNVDVRAAFAPILQRADNDLELFFVNILQAGKFAVAAELKVRESQRLGAVGRLRGEELAGPDVPYNAQAVASARRALEVLGRAQGAFRQGPLTELREAHRDPEALRALDEGKEVLTQHLVKFNIGVEDFKEVLGTWDENTRVTSESGAEGLFRSLNGQLERFIELRREDDRGTRPHSPLPAWKYNLIASVLGVAVLAVIVCFVWFGCTWVLDAIRAVAPWLIEIINRGC